jgi:hypothetical protein
LLSHIFFFFGLIPLFLIIAFFKGKNSFNINIHDIHFVSDVTSWCFISMIYFTLIGFSYFYLYSKKKLQKKWLIIIHLIFQIIVLIPFLYLLIVENNDSLSFKNYEIHLFMVTYFIIASFVFIISIVLHFINFFTSLFLQKAS